MLHAVAAAIGGAFSEKGVRNNPFMIMQDELLKVINQKSEVGDQKSEMKANRKALAQAFRNLGGKVK